MVDLIRRDLSDGFTPLVNEPRPYEGSELELFARARTWKAYWSAKIRPHLGRSMLEVGAGLGTNTPYLLGPAQAR